MTLPFPQPVPTWPATGDPAAARWAQLTYTCRGASEETPSGGWQFTPTGVCTDAELARVLADLPTQLRVPRPLPRYPSAADLAAVPRRLALVASGDEAAFLVHSVPAGHDATGRPGNVFSHVLLDRQLAAALRGPEPRRPIEFWRSPQWLTPYGPEATERARCDQHRPIEPGPVVGRETVVGFLYDPHHDRVDRLADLLDSTAAALTGGPPVVLVVDDPDEGALWIGLLSFLAAPAAALRLSFSTYESFGDLLADGARSRVSVVLSEDFHVQGPGRALAALSQPDLAVLDLSARSTGPGAQGRFGPLPASSDWSDLALDLYNAGEVVLDDCLVAMDVLSAANGTGVESCPWLALALAVLHTPQLRQAWPVAEAVRSGRSANRPHRA